MTLDTKQKEAVEYCDGPLMVIAGAGSGKTRVITRKITHLIQVKNISPDNIVGLTFGKKAAAEMKIRLEEQLKTQYSPVHMTTIHSFCDFILKEHGSLIGVSAHYKLVEDVRKKILLRKLFAELKPKHFIEQYDPLSTIQSISDFISRAKDELVTPKEFTDYTQKLIEQKIARFEYPNGNSEENRQPDTGMIEDCALLYTSYQNALEEKGFLDYGDQVMKAYELLKTSKNLRLQLQERFQYIVVDEYQDTNIAQIEFLFLLAERHKKICVVGDDDQAIYRFRGASYASFKRFRTHFPNCKEILLETNYRSTKNILACAGLSIVHNNPSRLYADKKHTAANETGNHVFYILNRDPQEEASAIAGLLFERLFYAKNGGGENIAVIYRNHQYGKLLYKECEKRGIPCKTHTQRSIINQPENKYLISLIRLLADTGDFNYLFSVFEHPSWKLTAEDLAKLFSMFQERDALPCDIVEFEHIDSYLSNEGCHTVRRFQSFIKDLTERSKNGTAVETLQYIIAATQNADLFVKESPLENNSKTKDMVDLYNFVFDQEEFNEEKSLAAFIDFLDYFLLVGGKIESEKEPDPEPGKVNFLTAHAAKGLEFDTVYIISLTSRRFPYQKKKTTLLFPEQLLKEEVPKGDFHLQDERRLFYVAVTRARRELFLSTIEKKGSPKSKFVQEILESKQAETIIKELKAEPHKNSEPRPNRSEDLTQMDPDDKSKAKSIVSVEIIKDTIIQSLNSLMSFPHNTDEYVLIRTALKDLTEKEFSRPEYSKKRFSGEPHKDKSAGQDYLKIDHSKFETYHRCPLQYKFRYVFNIKAPKTASPVFGQTIHATLQHFYQKIRNGEKPGISVLMDIFNNSWISEGFKDPAEEERFRRKGERQLNDFYESNKHDFRPPRNIEEYFKFSLGTILVVGKIDRIDNLDSGSVEIVDYKTGKSKSQKDADSDLQMSIYAEAVKQIYGTIPERLTFCYLDSNEYRTTRRNEVQLADAMSKIRETASQIQNERFDPVDGNHCRSCAYRWICPIKQAEF